MVRVFNMNTMEKIREFEAHMDYIRSLEVHPVHPYVLTSSDDMQIKLWDWEKQWANVQSFDGHSHYVMMVKFNPKDTNTFASASLDRSVKVWSLGSPLPNFSLEGHTAGVNCVDYFQGGDKPYIASGSDDHTVKIWDYQTKACVHTLQTHTNNVSAVVFHPFLPVILSGSEDGSIRVWHSTTYRLESTLNYGWERCWTLGVSPYSNKVAAGYDEGVVVLQLGREMPVVSMDKSGKILVFTAKDIQAGALRNLSQEKVHDGEVVDVAMKSAGPTETYLQTLEHNSNGRFVSAVGDGEYVIYTSLTLRNKSFGQAVDFGWSTRAPNDYCVRDGQNKIHIFQDFKEINVFSCSGFTPEAVFGGWLVGVTSSEHITFYTWQGKEAARIDVAPKAVFWSDEGNHVCLACEDSYYVLALDDLKLQECVANGDAAGAEKCFEYLDEVAESAKTGQWVGDCFLYTNAAGRLNYYVGGEVVTLAHLDREMILLGFLPKENRVFLMDKTRAVVSYQVLEPVLKYQTAVVRGDFQLANSLLPSVPKNHYGKIARFLEAKGFKEAALAVATDADHKFELALGLERFEVALKLMREEIAPAQTAVGQDHVTQDVAAKWKQLGDLALSRGNVMLAEECASKAEDFGSLLLIYSSVGNKSGLRDLYEKSRAAGLTNIAFVCSVLLRDYDACVDVLKDSGRTPEAAFMALNHAPSRVSEIVKIWKKEMVESGHGLGVRIAKALADPEERPDLFPGFDEALEKEVEFKEGLQSVQAAILKVEPVKAEPVKAIPVMAAVASPAKVVVAAVASPAKPAAAAPAKPESPREQKRTFEQGPGSPAAVVVAASESPRAVVVAPKSPTTASAPSDNEEFVAVANQRIDAELAERLTNSLINSAMQQDALTAVGSLAGDSVALAAADNDDLLDQELQDEVNGQDVYVNGDDDDVPALDEEEDIGLEEDWE